MRHGWPAGFGCLGGQSFVCENVSGTGQWLDCRGTRCSIAVGLVGFLDRVVPSACSPLEHKTGRGGLVVAVVWAGRRSWQAQGGQEAKPWTSGRQPESTAGQRRRRCAFQRAGGRRRRASRATTRDHCYDHGSECNKHRHTGLFWRDKKQISRGHCRYAHSASMPSRGGGVVGDGVRLGGARCPVGGVGGGEASPW